MPSTKSSDMHAIGERKFIKDHLAPFRNNLPSSVVEGIGDDCSVIQRDKDNYTLVTTDMTVQNTHFLSHVSQPEDVGARVIEVNSSDIASMGGTPEFVWLSLGLPRNIPLAWVDRFLLGIETTLQKAHVSLLGGDTIETDREIFVDVTMMGYVNKAHCKKRSGAKKGDVVCVTDYLGNAGCALKMVFEEISVDEEMRSYLLRHHVHPRAQREEGVWLGQQKSVGAMIDVSDGIASDLHHIAEMSHVGLTIDLDQLPLSPQMKHVCAIMKWDPLPFATSSGDDFCLLVTIEEGAFPAVKEAFLHTFGTPLFDIGRVSSTKPGVTYLQRGRQVSLPNQGYNHFSL